MTTQVVLMNGLGIALASDSAVTAGGKVLNTSEKIFELPHPHKAAILTSGRARFMGMPWEVLLSAWTETLDNPLASIAEYQESLFSFLRSTIPNTGDLSSAEVDYLEATLWGEQGVYNAVFKALQAHIKPYYDQALSPEDHAKFLESEWDEDFRKRISDMLPSENVASLLDALEELGNDRKDFVACPDITEGQAKIWLEKYWSTRTNDYRWEEFYTDWPIIPGLKDAFIKLHAIFIVHADYSGESNVNIVGYGAKDMFPSWRGTFLHGAMRGTLLKRFEESVESASWPVDLFFGQTDAISALTGREDQVLVNAAVETSKSQLSAIMEKLSESEDAQVLETAEYIKESLNNDPIRQRMLNESQNLRRDPFRKAIGMSPIMDLAEFAAQLVGVQAAYAAMTQDNPSVGGFVDLGMITHRRGFEWVRHKH